MTISEKSAYLKGLMDGLKLSTETDEGKMISAIVDLVVTETDPGFAGNTATNALKPATVETGAQVNVPLFIEIGDKIQIDTRTGEYLGRSKA